MNYENLFDRAISFLSRSTIVKRIFDVETIYMFEDDIWPETNKRYNPFEFYPKRLPELIKFARSTPSFKYHDFYNNEKHRELIYLLDDIAKSNEYETDNENLLWFITNNIAKSARFYILLMMYLCVGYTEIKLYKDMKLSSFENSFKSNNNLNRKTKSFYWYRGVTNIDEHDLIPSMYRTISKKPFVHIDNAYVDNLYSLNNAKREYIKIFKTFNQDDFYAYMQHSIAYSPLIDFTNNIDIAGSFATSFTNSYEFENKDAGIYLLKRDTGLRNNNSPLDIDVYSDLLTPISPIFGKPLMFCTINDFEVKYNIILGKSNDRMKYQDGLFLRIYHAVFVKGKLLFPNSTSSIYYIRIPYSGMNITKDQVIDDIEKNHKEYTYDFLMDPYKWFSKRHK